MPKKTDYQKAMRKNYPPRYFSDAKQAENYKTLTDEKKMGYTVQEHKGQFIVDEPHKGSHPYWRPVRGEPEKKFRYYDEEGREV